MYVRAVLPVSCAVGFGTEVAVASPVARATTGRAQPGAV